MKNGTMRFFLYSIKLPENKELVKTFLPRHSKTFSFYTDNKYKQTKKHIKRKNDNNQL